MLHFIMTWESIKWNFGKQFYGPGENYLPAILYD